MKIMALILLSLNLMAANREIGNASLDFVGEISLRGRRCSGFLAKHGLLVTAKHCFSHYGEHPDTFSSKGIKVVFPSADSEVVITSIERLMFDSGENDIAYLVYNPEQTSNQITLGNFYFSKDIEGDFDIYRAGFSGEEEFVNTRILTKGCRFNQKTGYFPARITDPGYDGLLLDTECPAWFGDSGGPVIYKSEDKFVIVGILSHTFEVDYAGNIPLEAIERDIFGRFVKTSFVSPFSQAIDIWNLLES